MRLSEFDSSEGFSRGRPKFVEALWYISKMLFFLTPFPWPVNLKVFILKIFGASIGRGCNIQPEVSIHFPWKLELGDDCWIGKQTEIHNMEKIIIEDNVAIAHRVFITSGSHDYSLARHPYRNKSTVIRSNVWITSCAFIGPGVEIGEGCVIFPGAVVTKKTEPWKLIGGNPAQVIGERKIKDL
jgi:putative colanic acid biosynthesis acetyltransferase WcaF